MSQKYPSNDLKSICNKLDYRLYGEVEFTASDTEIYDVLSAVHGSDAMLLLVIGIRTREAAISFLTDHDLDSLIRDHQKITKDALERDIPAFTAMSLMGFHGSTDRDEPRYLDALEANGIRAIREANKYYPTVPNLIMNDEISLADVKIIGATRLFEHARNLPVIAQLKKIHEGTSPYDAHTLKELLIKSGPNLNNARMNIISMANKYGAARMLELHDLHRASEFAWRIGSTTYYSDDEKGRMIVFDDHLAHICPVDFERKDVIALFENGVSAEEVVDGLAKDMTLIQIMALKNGVHPNLSDGWL